MKAPGPARARTRGFTLIEITIVMVIIAILFALVTVSIGHRAADEKLQMEAQRLQQLIGLAAEQAQLRSQQIGLEFGSDGYRFLLLGKDRKWSIYTSHGSLRPRKLPLGFQISIKVDDHNLPPRRSTDDEDGQNNAGDDKKNKPKPQVMIYSSGEMTIFTAELSIIGNPVHERIKSDALGHLKLSTVREGINARR